MTTMLYRAYRTGACILALATALSTGFAKAQTPGNDAEPATRSTQETVARSLDFNDKADFEDANYGFIGTLPDAEVKTPEGRVVWSVAPYSFIKGKAPATVNPSLWRQSQLNNIHGLFKVVDRVYQVRGLDSANMTIVEGDHSLIVIDSLFTAETARAALDLYFQHRPRKPVGALIYTHGHVDHFGGSRGVVSDADVSSGLVQVIAPKGFMETAIAENVIAGNAMSRRGQYQFGGMLPVGPRAAVGIGCCTGLSRGTVTLVPPTATVDLPIERRTIDGVELEFHLVPGAEAPTEMIIYLPQFRILNMAEIVTHMMHNLYAMRGAEVRDANAWSHYISGALEKFGDKTDILIAQHQWPTRGRDRIVNLLEKHRDLYKFVNDQSLRMINQGYTPGEISEKLRLPASLSKEWANRDYYGVLSQNARAVYQKYMGWYDGNPANLNPLPPVEASSKAVEYMGGGDAVIARARQDFEQGNYRWVASVMNQVVFADPSNKAARSLGADALEQLAYQAESGLWRSAYLVGAMELRDGVPKLRGSFKTLTPDALRAVPTAMYFDLLGVQLNAARAEGKHLVLNWNLTDELKKYTLNLENSALTWVEDKQDANADASLTLARSTLDAILLGETTFPEAIKSGAINVGGQPEKLMELLGMLDKFNPSFPIVEPDAARQ
ncbi:alkyl sulfatase BDS1-like metallo-beta-lactamase superfamily hydrolase [Mesorhizobium soli]|uniref:alkyl/aryl-sulfatase n=1 Tax=Pseudaminobacter soli (ex Li et al. 2025) TaxID=1295366 RepID=UPI002476D20A|nr:alkyl sulfatase dimerization domain-containing protein [Mesorhizobium soli]MDH6230769.1 alkyl sulfatase BDS1-like metallo-beta-lactamase superfamily hydrolase [Mesorhizobium soli]